MKEPSERNESEAIQTLIKALIFYADPDNWHPKGTGEFFPIQTDGGDMARSALAEFAKKLTK